MELDLLGLGLPQATVGQHQAAQQQRPADDLEKTTAFFDDEPPRLASVTPPPVRAPPPANKLMMTRWPAAAAAQATPPNKQVSVPGAAGDQKSPRASQLGCFRGIFPSTPSEHQQGASVAAVNVFGGQAPPVAAAGTTIFEGSSSTSPLTIIYNGSVHAFDSVPMEQAEKILFITAKEAQAAETPALFQQPVPVPAAAPPPTSAAQMTMMLLGLTNVEDSLRPKRTLSLARFLHKRKQRVESAATATYPPVEELHTQMDPRPAVYAHDKAPFGDMGQTWAFEEGPKSQKENHGEEEEVNTELKI